MKWIGIDNGLTGAVAVFDDVALKVEIFDTPTFTVEKPNLRKGGKSKTRNRTMFDERGMNQLIENICSAGPVQVGIEEAIAPYLGPQKNKLGENGEVQGERFMGSASLLSVGTGFGIWLGILAAHRVAFERIHPASWKATMMRDMPKGKDAGRMKALQLFPSASQYLARKMDHNRADALLIAECRRRRG